jgi:hypothetical protein
VQQYICMTTPLQKIVGICAIVLFALSLSTSVSAYYNSYYYGYGATSLAYYSYPNFNYTYPSFNTGYYGAYNAYPAYSNFPLYNTGYFGAYNYFPSYYTYPAVYAYNYVYPITRGTSSRTYNYNYNYTCCNNYHCSC